MILGPYWHWLLQIQKTSKFRFFYPRVTDWYEETLDWKTQIGKQNIKNNHIFSFWKTGFCMWQCRLYCSFSCRSSQLMPELSTRFQLLEAGSNWLALSHDIRCRQLEAVFIFWTELPLAAPTFVVLGGTGEWCDRRLCVWPSLDGSMQLLALLELVEA